jgi:hypothetical protein
MFQLQPGLEHMKKKDWKKQAFEQGSKEDFNWLSYTD